MASRAALIVALFVACTDDPPEGKLTDSTCPPTDKPTFDNFGSAFFGAHCLGCHSNARVGEDRNGAPPTIDFDTQALVRENTSRIDKQAAAGATIVNRLMPPASAESVPTDDERFRLGEYMACLVGR